MRLYWYNIKEMTTEEYDAAMAMMSAERRRRISDFPAEDDRKRSAAGELLLRRALAEQLGVSAEAAPLTWEESGNPQQALRVCISA